MLELEDDGSDWNLPEEEDEDGSACTNTAKILLVAHKVQEPGKVFMVYETIHIVICKHYSGYCHKPLRYITV